MEKTYFKFENWLKDCKKAGYKVRKISRGKKVTYHQALSASEGCVGFFNVANVPGAPHGGNLKVV